MPNPELNASNWNKMDICSFHASEVVALIQHQKPIRSIVYVKNEEARLFFAVILPLVHQLANSKRVVLSNLQRKQHEFSELDFPLFMINAAETKYDLLRSFIRLESNGRSYLQNPDNPAFIYIYNSGETAEKLRLLMPSLIDGDFYDCCRSESTHVVISGVFGQTGIPNCLDPATSSRCGVFGLEWRDKMQC